MKNKLLAIILIGTGALFLANCSKNNRTQANSTNPGYCTVPGQVYTTQGCLPQSSSCGMNYGYLNGSCYPATGVSGINSMCGIAGNGYQSGAYGYNQPGAYGYNQNLGYGYNQAGTGCLNQQGMGYPQGGQYSGSCLSTDVVNTQMGTLTVGVCQPYCAQYGRKYGYLNGSCYPAY